MKLVLHLVLLSIIGTSSLCGYDEYDYCNPYDDYSYSGKPDCALGMMLFLIQQNIDDLAERLNLAENDLDDLRASFKLLRYSLELKMNQQYEQLRTQMKELVQATFQEYCAHHAAQLEIGATHPVESQLNHVPEQAAAAPVNSFFGGLVHYIFSVFKKTEIRNQQLCAK